MLGSIHHIDLTVASLERSVPFYELVLPLVGFRRRTEKSTPMELAEVSSQFGSRSSEGWELVGRAFSALARSHRTRAR